MHSHLLAERGVPTLGFARGGDISRTVVLTVMAVVPVTSMMFACTLFALNNNLAPVMVPMPLCHLALSGCDRSMVAMMVVSPARRRRGSVRRVIVTSMTMMTARLGRGGGRLLRCVMMVVVVMLGGAYRWGPERQGQKGERSCERGLEEGFHAGFPF